MSYFSDLYSAIRLPKQSATNPNGLRNAQIGAIHSIGRHFALYQKEAALVVMPTGSGKTAVLSLSPFLIEAERVLVISSSKLVRGQIYDELQNLKTLIKIGVFDKKILLPKCKEITSNINSLQEWNELKDYHFVIGIPKSLTAKFDENILPPPDLFDLVLIDESHHLPASTWTLIANHFKNSKKIYYTATPFRRDKKEIKGKLIYSYSLSKAFEDKIFGEVGYHSVKIKEDEIADKDKLIAIKTAEIFRKDKNEGLDHSIMVRTNTKKHAESLKTIYDENTELNLKVVHSSHTFSHIKSTIKKLRTKELDGIICVNMFAEGFDFPNLKIAAIHEHHKSLAVTLQFIGRFARTNAPNLGKAKFIAAESDIVLGQKHLLYQDGSLWSEIIVNLSEDSIEEIEEIQEFNNKFENKISEENFDLSEITLSTLKPFSHIKIYRTKEFNLDGKINFKNQKIIFHQVAEDENTVIFITEEAIKPKWIQIKDIKHKQYFLYILFYNKDTQLLYLHFSGKKNDTLFESLLDFFQVYEYNSIPKSDIHKALHGLNDLTFFNIGLQNISAQSGESYRTISGGAAHNMLTNSTGRMYSNGHVQGSGTDIDGKKTTIGYSSGSKIWGSEYINIKDFIKFCKLIGSKINSNVIVKTNTSIDNIPIAKQVLALPKGEKISFINWNHSTYKTPPLTAFSIDGTDVYNQNLIELILTPDFTHNEDDRIHFFIKGIDFETLLEYSFKEGYKYLNDNDFRFLVHYGDANYVDLLSYLTDNPLIFQLTDLSTISNGNELLIRSNKVLFDQNRLEDIKWKNYNTDISAEFKNPSKGKRHIHDVLCEILLAESPNILIYDHGPYEVADFILFRELTDKIVVEIYHVKAADNEKTGDRVSYLYEVCGQAEKSLIYTQSKKIFKNKILSRIKNKDNDVQLLSNNNKIKLGTETKLTNILNSEKTFKYEIFAVQPGLSKKGLSEKLSHLLASTDDYIRTNSNNERLRVWCSEK